MKAYQIDSSAAEQRLDRYIKKLLPHAKEGEIQRWIRTKKIKCNRLRASANQRLQIGDEISIFLPDPVIDNYSRAERMVSAQAAGLTIVYEDEQILIVNKPVGLLTHPDKNEFKKTLASHVQHYLKHLCTATFRPASVNRLDKNTSGLVLFGKTYPSLKELNALMRSGKINKIYKTITHGQISKTHMVKGYLSKDGTHNIVTLRSQPSKDAKAIKTIVRPIALKNGYTLAEVDLITGRSHQIRVSLASLGYPIVGDVKYGGHKTKGQTTQLLHAEKLSIDGQQFSYPSQALEEFWSMLTN